MENPLWNLILRAASATSGILLLLGTGLVLASIFELTENRSAGPITLVFGCGLSIATFAGLSISHARLIREQRHASEAAHQLAQGVLIKDPTDNELLDSLRHVADYLREKSQLLDLVAAGELPESVAVRSDGDVLGKSLKTMVERLQTMMQTRESRDRLQQSVMKLLNEVSEVAAGDLTVKADSEHEITGAIADSFNSMTLNLRSLIKQVKDVTMQVGASASTISETTEQLAQGSLAQASQIARTTSAVASMSAEIREVSGNAAKSAAVAAECVNSARQGTRAADDNINAMNSVRRQVQETAKRIKRLGERAQEISQIVSLIEDLSDRTSLLALNATLQASASDTKENGFAVVAEEVERLAERSNRLTQQIAGLTQAINTETNEVVSSMEETIHEVIVSSTLAERAGRALVDIETVSNDLEGLLRSISDSTKVQARSSEDISKAMSGISEVTEIVQLGSRRAAESVRTLVRLAGELRDSVSPFKLPADPVPPKRIAQEAVIHVN